MRERWGAVLLTASLGCGGARATSAATADAGASTTDASTASGAHGQTLAAGCGPAGRAYACDPITNAGCDGAKGEACDDDRDGGFACYPPPNDVAIGGACNDQSGPSCAGGLVCDVRAGGADGVCGKYCCTAADCAAGQTCAPFDGTFGSLGACE